MSGAARFVAPQLLAVEGGAALPGLARWHTAFTTAAAGWPTSQWGASHLHRSQFWTVVNAHGECSAVQWRLESQPATPSWPGATRMVEGEARTLDLALTAAFEAARRGPVEHLPNHPYAPAFIALPSLPDAPRIWGCAAFFQPSDAPDAAPFAQTCFIREFRRAGETIFTCTLETGDAGDARHQHWDAPDVQTAVLECEQRMQGACQATAPAEPGTRRPASL